MTSISGLLFERVRVLVEERRAEEHQQVADDVNDQVEEKREAGDADQELHPDRRGEEQGVRDAIKVSLLLRHEQAQVSIRSFLVRYEFHEYQAKAILARHGVPVPRGEVTFAAADAVDIAKRLGTGVVVVKAQIHAGGRGKGGGVKLARSPQDAEKLARAMIGMTLITHQTGPEGRVVGRVLIEEGLQMQRELYLSLVLDRAAGQARS